MITANASTAIPTVEQDMVINLNVTEYSVPYFTAPYFTVYIQIMYVLIVFSCLCGLMGNMKVIWLLSFRIKRNTFTTYILNLAVADFGTLLSVLAYIVDVACSYLIREYDEHSTFYKFTDVLVFFTYSASMYFLTAISLERALSVRFPIWYRCRRPGRSSAVVSFLLWSLSGLLSGMLLLSYLWEANFIVSTNIISITNLLICTPLMIASSLTVWIIICRNSWRRQPSKLYVAILVTLLVFIVFGIPLSVSHFFFYNTEGFPLEVLEATYLLAAVNSSVNPLIYYLVGRDRTRQSRESLKVVFQRLFKDDTDPREGN
uniref:proto-oncogene Mas-like n=1 Tax=Euleptes europaea TaxID=460621 RepID=UPI002540AE07|nr:proto-oncogene Mas-like [Euleptes europaea]